ncbi:MAG: PIN domain-containing protein [Steroidobacteraceae bacterium]
MTGFLLDTNILSNLIKPAPSPGLLAWMSKQSDDQLFISTMTLAEIWKGILELPRGARRTGLETWYRGPEGPEALFTGRILSFDQRAALVWARLMADGKRSGKPRSPLDMIVAAIAAVHDCRVVTDNSRDFAGMDVLNPV